ncbi:DNA-directed RNA polymerase sigma-E/Sigma-24/FecI [Kozakia baliensis NRIC 0488]|uniref:sigma-70 family RNA polymerase sigma factor n=1 Tax=Kozakia baliensis TaxID=153496 RepID=UPI0009F59682|nr:sigma-70 family RNA polymerase sigma factor [Kozakia baliensis]GBR25394.1 DNA-directed RNA polymerase sigma-E/Sigma-24/FecI [Kozakia baliensis NRIC 0488]GEL63974.1 RNA polymerase sigma factor [Kozakia baliensis]
MRKGIAGILPDLRGFARFLTRDASSADDLVQDTIVKALAAQEQFQLGTSLKAWLFTIQRNTFYEQRRRLRREKEILDDIGQEPEVSADTSANDTVRDQVLDLSGLLWQLPDIFREALILVGAQELSYEEAAQICGVAVGTMKARVSRARLRLAELANPGAETVTA